MSKLLTNATEKMRTVRRDRDQAKIQKVMEKQAALVASGASCMNCEVPLTGPYCHVCGQKDDDLRRPIWTFILEMLDTFFSSDSRFVKSVILLALVPGGLTRAFMEGRRSRYMPPFRLYIIVSVLFFLLVAAMNVAILDVRVTPNEDYVPRDERIPEDVSKEAAETSDAIRDEISKALDEESDMPPEVKERLKKFTDSDLVTEGLARAQEEIIQIDRAATGLENAEDASGGAGTGEEQPQPQRANGQAKRERIYGISSDDLPYSFSVDMFVKLTDDRPPGLKQEHIDKIMKDPDQEVFIKEMVQGFSKGLQDPEKFNDLFNTWLPRAMFVLVPVFALILRVFHWGKDRYLLNHLVFSLHFHSFLFMVMMAFIVVIPAFGAQFGLELFWWGTSLYLIIALKIGLDQSWLRAFIKAGFIWVSYFMVMSAAIFSAIFAGLRDL